MIRIVYKNPFTSKTEWYDSEGDVNNDKDVSGAKEMLNSTFPDMLNPEIKWVEGA